jgi:hypothetical protein
LQQLFLSKVARLDVGLLHHSASKRIGSGLLEVLHVAKLLLSSGNMSILFEIKQHYL